MLGLPKEGKKPAWRLLSEIDWKCEYFETPSSIVGVDEDVDDEEIELGEDEDDILVDEELSVVIDVTLEEEEAVVTLVVEELLEEGEEIEEELGFILLHPAKKAVANNIGIIFNFFIIPLN